MATIKPADWVIYRLEFIFLNPAEYRWQVFQYWPGPTRDQAVKGSKRSNEATYRTQAQSLLRWVHDAAVVQGYARPDSVPAINIDAPEIRKLLLSHIKGRNDAAKKKHLDEFLEEYQARIAQICQDEGIAEGAAKLVKRIGSSSTKIKLNPQDALDILSALFVAHDWDIWGRLSYPRKNKMEDGDRIIPKEDVVNPSRLRSFSYVIDYPKGESQNILEYKVDLACGLGTQVHACSETDNTDKAKSRKKLGSLVDMKGYFDHCNNIRKKQANWYRLYGCLIDEIAKRVAKDDTIFIRCFPLRICGYDHFLQVLLRPTDENVTYRRAQGIELPDVFPEFEHIEGADPLPHLTVLKECLREMIVQMHVAAFQRHVAKDLNDASIKDLRSPYYRRRMFAKHAPNLVRMERVWVDDRAFAYSAREPHDFEEWYRIGPLDREWVNWEDKFDDDPMYVTLDDGNIKVHIPWEGDFKTLSELLGGTGEMRLEEQWEWLNEQAKHRLSVLRMAEAAEKFLAVAEHVKVR